MEQFENNENLNNNSKTVQSWQMYTNIMADNVKFSLAKNTHSFDYSEKFNLSKEEKELLKQTSRQDFSFIQGMESNFKYEIKPWMNFKTFRTLKDAKPFDRGSVSYSPSIPIVALLDKLVSESNIYPFGIYVKGSKLEKSFDAEYLFVYSPVEQKLYSHQIRFGKENITNELAYDRMGCISLLTKLKDFIYISKASIFVLGLQ